MIGTKEGIYVYNEKKVHVHCHFYEKCMWCGLKYKQGDDVVDAMYLTKEGLVWSGESIHSKCDELRHEATKKEMKMQRLYKMLSL